MSDDAQKAARWDWLVKNCIGMADGDMDCSDHPELFFGTDWYNEHREISAVDRITNAIDAKIAKDAANGN